MAWKLVRTKPVIMTRSSYRKRDIVFAVRAERLRNVIRLRRMRDDSV